MSAPEKIDIAGTEYTREEFIGKLIGNNWSANDDGQVMEALYTSFLKAQEALETAKTYETKSELKNGAELYTVLMDTVMPKDRPGKQKRELLREIAKWEKIEGNERTVVEEYMNSLAFVVMRERHEADKEGFIESMKWGGWDRPEDKEFLGKLYDQRLDKEGNIIKEFDVFLNSLDRETGGQEVNRKETLTELKKMLEKIPEGERTAEQKELLSYAEDGPAAKV